MTLTSPTEAALDAALGEALYKEPKFSEWFLGRTRFRGEIASCVFCRYNNPWSRVRLERRNPLSGGLEVLLSECETDVLAVYETGNGRRLALHVENKLAGGSFTRLQPELYRARLQQWKNRPKLGDYIDATSILVAPKQFFERYRAQAEIFETYVSHEELAERIPLFSQSSDGGT